MVSKRVIFGGVSLVLSATSVLAADLPVSRLPVIENVKEWNPWMLRVRAVGNVMVESSDLKFNGIGDHGSLKALASGGPELDVSYFFTKNIATELSLGTSFHGIKSDGAIKEYGKTERTWILPSNLTLQYYFDLNPNFKPYLGAGVNYTSFFKEEEKGNFSHSSFSNRFGVAVQAGTDIMLNKNWGINFDVKKVFLKTKVNATYNSDPMLNVDTAITGDVKLDPWLIGTGVTYKF